MTNITLYIATSLDGYIARTDGGIDWLSMVEREGEDYGYAAFYESVDAIVSGSRTYELVLGFREWPYPGKISFVFTRRALRTDRDDVVFLPHDVKTGIAKIATQGFRRIWLVGGGALVGAFLRERLIDEYIISTLPILLGDGIRLFPPTGLEEPLELVSSRQFPSGLVQTHYRRPHDSPERRSS